MPHKIQTVAKMNNLTKIVDGWLAFLVYVATMTVCMYSVGYTAIYPGQALNSMSVWQLLCQSDLVNVAFSIPLIHLVVYGVLGFLGGRISTGGPVPFTHRHVTWIGGLLIYCFIVEMVQRNIPPHNFRLDELAQGWIGIVLGYIIGFNFNVYKANDTDKQVSKQ